MSIADRINLALACGTALMALATLGLAWYTRNLAKGANEGLRQTERHHQEDLRPFCTVDFRHATAQDPFALDWSGNPQLIDAETRRELNRPPADTIAIRGELRNKGKGLAKDVVLYFNRRLGSGERQVFRLTRPIVVSGLIGAEETIEIDIALTERDVMQIRDPSGWRPFEWVPFIVTDTYEIVLEYKDVFDNVFRTVHPRGIWHDMLSAASSNDEAKQVEHMTGHNRPLPVFLTGRQAMQTVADIAFPSQASLPAAPDASID